MYSFTVYESRYSTSFRVVAGEHSGVTVNEDLNPSNCSTRVYQGKDRETAAHTAHAAEKRADIKSQIARFFAPEDVRPRSKTYENSAPAILPAPGAESVVVPQTTAAPVADNDGGNLYSLKCNPKISNGLWICKHDIALGGSGLGCIHGCSEAFTQGALARTRDAVKRLRLNAHKLASDKYPTNDNLFECFMMGWNALIVPPMEQR